MRTSNAIRLDDDDEYPQPWGLEEITVTPAKLVNKDFCDFSLIIFEDDSVKIIYGDDEIALITRKEAVTLAQMIYAGFGLP